MKRLVGILAALFLVMSAWSLTGVAPAQATHWDAIAFPQSSSLLALTEAERRNAADDKLLELGNKIDLNNSDVRDFRSLRGFYPTLASKIIQNSPYDSVEEVLDIPGLSERQLERLQANLDNFIVTDAASVFNAGDDRYNPGVY